MYYELLLLTIFSFNVIEASEGNETKSCITLLEKYGDTLKNFLACSMSNAVPVTFCLSCSMYYQNLTLEYDVLKHAKIKEGNKTIICYEKYIDQNRLNLVLKNHVYFADLWNQAACTECFSGDFTVYSNKTLEMFQKLGKLKQCISDNWDLNPCTQCAISYNEANTFYNKEFVKKHKENICFDIRDDVNRTRLFWSKSLNCCKKEANFVPFTVIASFIACVPVIFYLSSYFYTKRHNANQLSVDILTSNDFSNGNIQNSEIERQEYQNEILPINADS